MAEHVDINMLFLKKQRYKMENEKSFLSGEAFIQDSFCRFQPRLLMDGRFQMMLPEEFSYMPDHIINKRYPMENKPNLVLCSNRYTETLSFTISPRNGEEANSTSKKVWSAMQRFFPQNVFYDSGVIQAEQIRIFWLEYKSFGNINEIYNILFLFALDNDLVTGAFQCEFTDYDEWKQVAFLMLQTIQTTEPSENLQEVSL